MKKEEGTGCMTTPDGKSPGSKGSGSFFGAKMFSNGGGSPNSSGTVTNSSSANPYPAASFSSTSFSSISAPVSLGSSGSSSSTGAPLAASSPLSSATHGGGSTSLVKPNPVVALDIGTSTVRVVVAVPRSEGRVDIVGIGSAPSRGVRKGVVINIEATVEAISRAVAQAEKMAGIEISSVFAGISGSHIKGINSHGIVAIKNREVSQFDVEKVIEAAKAVAIPLDREILHVLPQEFLIDEQDGIREPLGISGVRLEARVHMVTGAVASAQNIVKCANRCGLEVEDIVLAGLASGRAVLAPEEQELGVCLVDIGGGTTDVMVYRAGAVRHSAVIPLGGTHITQDISAGLGTPVAAAEEIKCRYGVALSSLVSKDDTIEVPSTGGRQSRVLSRQLLAEIIEPRVAEIFSFVQRELTLSGLDEMMSGGMVITGGSARLTGIAALAEKTFNLPVRIAAPFDVGGMADLVRGTDMSAAVGLVMLGGDARLGQAESFSPRKAIARSLKKVSGWFSRYF